MTRRSRIVLSVVTVVALVAVVAFVVTRGDDTATSNDLVWCVGPGEQVTPELKREYPELLIPRSACDAINGE